MTTHQFNAPAHLATALATTARRHPPAATTHPTAPITLIRSHNAIDRGVAALTDVLVRHSVAALRISLGLVFLGFGTLKLFPGVSPAEDLAIATVDKLTLGIIAGGVALLLTAVVECLIGLTLVTGRLLKAGLALLAVAMVGIMSPLVFFFGDLFPGLQPTIEGQYVLKDIILVTAASVVAARVLGARFVTGHAAWRTGAAALSRSDTANARGFSDGSTPAVGSGSEALNGLRQTALWPREP